MSKNVERENLAEEIAVMPEALEFAWQGTDDTAVILARLVKGLSLEKWDQVCHTWPLSNWRAFPVEESQSEKKIPLSENTELPITPFRDVHGALTAHMFKKLLDRELKRLDRNGGSLSLLGIGIANKAGLRTALGDGTVKRLDDLLGNIILSMLDNCDSLGITKDFQYLCSLPGLGQLAARNFAEKCQHTFEDLARPFFPSGGISAGKGAECAVGIVNILQGERVHSGEMIRRARKTLEIALARGEGHIHQETSFTPLEKTTLVQSQEKQFLFFGGDLS